MRNKFSLSDSLYEEEDFSEDTESILISRDQGDQTITGIVTDSQGIDHKFVKSTAEEDELSEAEQEIASDLFANIEQFLNPHSAAIKKLIEHRVLKNPNVLSELLGVSFRDLLKVFKKLMNKRSASLEAAYLHLLQLAEEKGSISKLANNDNDDAIVEAVLSSSTNEDLVTYKLKEKSYHVLNEDKKDEL